MPLQQAGREVLQSAFLAHGRLMFAAALTVTTDPAVAHDAVQDSLFALPRHLDTIARLSDSSLKSYLCRSARNRAIDLMRKQGREALNLSLSEPGSEGLLAGLPGIGTQTPEDTVILMMMLEELRRALSHLPGEDQLLLRLRYQDGLALRQIADLFRLKPATLRSRHSRLLKGLKEDMKEWQ